MGEFIKVAKVTDIGPGQARAVEVANRKIAIFNVSGRLYALEDFCPHKGAPLATGMLGGDTVTCEWHGATFKLDSGQCIAGPGGQGVPSYNVRLTGDDIEIEI